MRGATRLHLVRHASHGLLGRVLTGRMPGVGLSEAGRAEAAVLAERLVGRPIRRVLSSPLERAAETAAAIAGRLGLPVETEAGLDEIDFGAWTGQAFEALADQPGWAAWNACRGTAPTPGGETMLAAQARAVAAVMRLAETGGEVVCVSHQDVIKAVVAQVLGVPLDLLGRFALEPAHRCVVTIGEGAVVESVNLPA